MYNKLPSRKINQTCILRTALLQVPLIFVNLFNTIFYLIRYNRVQRYIKGEKSLLFIFFSILLFKQ